MKPTIIILFGIAFLFALVTNSWAIIEADVSLRIKKQVLDKDGNPIRRDAMCVIAAMWNNNKSVGYKPGFLFQDKDSYVHTDGDKERVSGKAKFYPKKAADQNEDYLTLSTPYAIKFDGHALYLDKSILIPTVKAIRLTLAMAGTFTIEETQDTKELRFYKFFYVSSSSSESYEVGSEVFDDDDEVLTFELAIISNDTSSKVAKLLRHPFRFGPCMNPTMQHAPL